MRSPVEFVPPRKIHQASESVASEWSWSSHFALSFLVTPTERRGLWMVKLNIFVVCFFVGCLAIATAAPSSSEEFSGPGACDIACPYMYEPICGSNGADYQSFSSSCFMRRFNCMKGESNWKEKNILMDLTAWPINHSFHFRRLRGDRSTQMSGNRSIRRMIEWHFSCCCAAVIISL